MISVNTNIAVSMHTLHLLDSVSKEMAENSMAFIYKSLDHIGENMKYLHHQWLIQRMLLLEKFQQSQQHQM